MTETNPASETAGIKLNQWVARATEARTVLSPSGAQPLVRMTPSRQTPLSSKE